MPVECGRKRLRMCGGAIWVATAALCPLIAADVPAAEPPATRPAPSLVTLNFPPNTPLSALVTYVSQRMGINFVYDEAMASQPITLRSPEPVAEDDLLNVLATVLQNRNLILEDTAVPRMKRIVPAQMAMMTPALVKPGHTLAKGEVVTQYIALKHAQPEQLMAIIVPMLSKPTGRATAVGEKRSLVVTDFSTNTARIVELIEMLDSAPDTTAEIVPVNYGRADMIGGMLAAMNQARMEANGETRRRVFVGADENTNQLILSGPTSEIGFLKQLVVDLDKPVESRQVIRFYKLTNTVARDLLATLRSIEGGDGQITSRPGPLQPPGKDGIPQFGAPLPRHRSGANPANESVAGAISDSLITADDNTNTIIIIAEPERHDVYKDLIATLDQRRAQVLIETTVVFLDTSNNFELGVDIAARHDNGKIISFSSLGVAKVDPVAGSLTPLDVTGGTLALLDPDIADVVIRALAGSTRSRLVSMPRVLVNDNEEGKLESVLKVPFQRTVITDSTTIVGEGDSADAGTKITITPHISNGNYLQLEYNVELSSFTGTALENLPPPSQNNIVESKVTIPNGHTIVVGGLNHSDSIDTTRYVPVLGQIPILKHLFRYHENTQTNSTLFVFIRPVILSDDQFRDLKQFSAVDRMAAGVPDDYPTSEPLLIRPPELP